MPPPEPFLVFTRKLEEIGVRYMVSGSVAAIFYGEPRMTNDVDIIVHLHAADASKLEAAFAGDEFYCPPREVIEIEIARSQRGHFNLIHHETGFKADIYPVCDDLHRWGLIHARSAQLEEDRLALAPPEYVIVRKLQFFREGGSQKHLRDISRMLAALGEEWSRETLISFIRHYQLDREWQQVLALIE
jgi:hypothetical protein